MSEVKKIGHGDKFPQHAMGMNPCIVCGREIKGEAKFWVEINYMDNSVWAADQGECPTSQGGFAVGSDCAKKFEKGVFA
jgi:hypothetical protein